MSGTQKLCRAGWLTLSIHLPASPEHAGNGTHGGAALMCTWALPPTLSWSPALQELPAALQPPQLSIQTWWTVRKDFHVG